MLQGPLCAEPIQGVAVILEEVTVNKIADSTETGTNLVTLTPALTGSLLKTIRSSVGTGFMDWSPRILLAMYSCEITTPPEALGRVYQVLSRRRGRILSEAMREGTPFFTISSLLPVAESFGFSDEIRKRTSGAAMPQHVFWGFEAVEGGDVDPRWVPQTEEELEDLGVEGDRENLARKYVDAVRDRKGMRRMLVKGGMGQAGRDPEKQKTLKR
jgi:ribosome assembly protein 1